MKNFLEQFNPKYNKGEATRAVMAAVLMVGVSYAVFAYGQAVTLSVTVSPAITFVTGSTGFATSTGTITPGTAALATTTLYVTTNDMAGWNVVLSGGNKSTGNNNLQTAGNAASIPDQTEWVSGAATTSAGNAVRIGSFTNSGNVLAFRVMSASSTNGAPFLATSWWGTTDSYTDSASTLWAGIASSTVGRQIGNAGTGSYTVGVHTNTVLYYLNVAATQPTGTYTAPLTYTATGN